MNMNYTRFIVHLAAVTTLGLSAMHANADETSEAVKTMEEYLAFVDYGGGTIRPEQIQKATGSAST